MSTRQFQVSGFRFQVFKFYKSFRVVSCRSWLNFNVIRNIIFDWSGTLVDDLPAVLKATNYVLTQAERPEMSLDSSAPSSACRSRSFTTGTRRTCRCRSLEAWFHSQFPAGAGLGLRTAARARVPGVLPREEAPHVPAEHRPSATISPAQCRVTGFDAFLDRPYTDVWDKRKKIHEILAENHLTPTRRCSSATCSTTSKPPGTAASIPAPC